jgi:hypothetical protein
MDEKSYMELVIDLAAFTPDQSWQEILKQLVSAMVACTGKLNSGDMGRLLAVAAAIHRRGERKAE